MWHLQFVTIEGLVGFGGGEEEELPAMEDGTGIGSEVAEGGVALDVAFLLVFGYEAKDVAPGIHAVEVPLTVILGIAANASFRVGRLQEGGLHLEVGGAAHGHEFVIDTAQDDGLAVVTLKHVGFEVFGDDGGYGGGLVGMSVDGKEGGEPLLRLQGERAYLIAEGDGGFGG